MKQIGDFLGRFIKLAQDSDDARQAIVDAVAVCGIKLRDLSKIKIQKSIITLPLSPAQKSEVFLKQKKILAELAKNPLTKNITVVR
jgi:hypothetical protein